MKTITVSKSTNAAELAEKLYEKFPVMRGCSQIFSVGGKTRIVTSANVTDNEIIEFVSQSQTSGQPQLYLNRQAKLAAGKIKFGRR